MSTVYNQKTYNMKVCIPCASLKYTLTLSSWRSMSPSYAPALLMPCSSLITSQNCKHIETFFSLKHSQNIFSHLLHFDLIWRKPWISNDKNSPDLQQLAYQLSLSDFHLLFRMPFHFFFFFTTILLSASITLKFTGLSFLW